MQTNCCEAAAPKGGGEQRTMGLKAGVAKADITPPVGVPQEGFSARTDVSQGVHDPLFAKALVLDDGATRMALVACDLIGLSRDAVARVRGLVEQRTGIAADHVVVACSHTHSGPALEDPGYLAERLVAGIVPAWTETLPHLIAGAVQMADAARSPARVGVGQGTSDIGVNRRQRNEQGVTIGQNPEGPIDRALTVLRVDHADGRPLAWLMNCACHAVVLGPENLLISADYPGYATAILERARGDRLTALFANGTAGNVNPRLRGTFEIARALGTALAGEAMKVAERTELTADPLLGVIRKEVLLPLKPQPPLETLLRSLRAKQELVRPAERDGDLPEDMSGPRGELVHLSHQVHAARALESRERPQDLAALRMRTEIQGFAVGDAAFVALPGEVFVEIGLAVKARSPFETTAVIGYANDYLVGYVPTAAAYDEGGYEPGWAIVSREAAEVLRDAAGELLAQLRGPASA